MNQISDKLEVQYHDCPNCYGTGIDPNDGDVDDEGFPCGVRCGECAGEGCVPVIPEGIYQLGEKLGVFVFGYPIVMIVEWLPEIAKWDHRLHVKDNDLLWLIVQQLESGHYIKITTGDLK